MLRCAAAEPARKSEAQRAMAAAAGMVRVVFIVLTVYEAGAQMEGIFRTLWRGVGHPISAW
jgi:hypothetical protein